MKAREEEMSYVRSMEVYTKVSREEARRAGIRPIGVRWIDTNKGDRVNRKYRSRLVGQEFKTYQDPGLFASTPPLEAMRLIISLVAQSNHGDDRVVMVNDISRAFFHAPSTRLIYVELPDEDKTAGRDEVGRLNMSLYGTRDASMNWQTAVSSHLASLGFQKRKGFPSVFYHRKAGIATMVHGDDYMSTW